MSPPRFWRPGGVTGALADLIGDTGFRVPDRIVTGVQELDLGAETLFLASELARLADSGPESDEGRTALLLALAVLAVQREGSTRIPLGGDTLPDLLGALGATEEEIEAARKRAAEPPEEAGWLGAPGAYRPLLSDGRQLSSQRLWSLEERVARALSDRLDRAPEPGDARRLDSPLRDLRTAPPILADGTPVLLSEEQERAVRSATVRPLSLITGGPGTGKTSVVVSIVRTLGRLGDWDSGRVALAAPTGRAADRLRASLLRFLSSLEDPPAPDRAILSEPPESSTLHRLLGFSPRSGRFRHHRNNPLDRDLVVVDEASMVDLFLMERILTALRPRTRLVLLGDADQLPSVEAGAVFRDLCRGARATVTLTHSYRMDAEDESGRQILQAAGRIRRGRPLRAGRDYRRREEPGEARLEGVEIVPGGRRARIDWWRRWAQEVESPRELCLRTFTREAGEWDPRDLPKLEELFRSLEEARILTAHRGPAGGTGAAAINGWFHEHHRRRIGRSGRGPQPLPGEPVLVTRNDYRRSLFNGDQGVVVLMADDDREPRPHALFRSEGGDFRAFPLESLRGSLELAWATTVHKAQGSEMDRVTVVLPDESARLLGRELLYTAITRARRSVTILGDPAVMDQGIQRSVQRHTGLGELLTRSARPEVASGPVDRQLDLPFD